MESSFKDAIRDHLQLKERNRVIEPTMPLARYRTAELAPVADTVEQDAEGRAAAPDRDDPAGWPTAESLGLQQPESLWARSPEFDWDDATSAARQSAA